MIELSEPLERRSFLKKLALGAPIAAGVLAFLSAMRAFVPKLTRDTTVYKVGLLTDFPVNAFTLSEKAQIYIYRDYEGVRAVSAICTHLGCMLDKSDSGFVCPCHGSSFNETGHVLSGPAPRALAWFRVNLAPDGQLVVDKKQQINSENKFRIT